MRSYVLLLALLRALGCAGVPLYNSELRSTAGVGLGAALAEVNAAYAVNRLYRLTRASVTKVIPKGQSTIDLLMKFGIKESECAKTSGKDPQTCDYRRGFFMPSFSCSTRVRTSGGSAQVLSLRCGPDSSSSSESSEELFSRGRHQFNVPFINRVPAPAAPATPSAPPVQPGRSLLPQMEEVQPRGDTFSNYLV
ncbi:secreted phosphoprotein 24 isoform X1 [Brachyistius frenatus]|uniref:secreted phosphoprotein 24 isoform X1 n=1 Tax=Brachyistius frenatus TaxID=100188 RepID=UPI0037E940D2